MAACQLIQPLKYYILNCIFLSRGLPRCSPAQSAHYHHHHFVRVWSDVAIQAFSLLATDDVTENAIRQLPDKFPAADSVPTSIFKRTFVCDRSVRSCSLQSIDRSLAAGHFPADSRRHFSPLSQRNRDWISGTFNRIEYFRARRCCQSSLNALLYLPVCRYVGACQLRDYDHRLTSFRV